MESQLHRTHGHHNEQQPYNTAAHQTVGLGEEQHEKKSVLGKVKAKAKKIKSKLTSHGHGHHHDHGHGEGEGYVSDEETVQDPEVHGAPIYDSASVTAPRGTPAAGLNSKSNLENPSSLMKEDRDRYESIISDIPVRPFAQWEKESDLGSDTTAEAISKPEDKHVSFGNVGGREGNLPYSTGNVGGRGSSLTHDKVGNAGGREGNFLHSSGNPAGQGRDFTHDSVGNVGGQGGTFTVDTVGNVRAGRGNLGHSVAGIGGSMGMEEDPNAQRTGASNYQSKVSDPTGGGEEIGVTSVIRSLDKMGIYDDKTHQNPRPRTTQNIYSTGTHNQFSPDSMPLENPQHDHNHLSGKPQSTNTGMVSSAASSLANTAALAKNAVASTLGYGGAETERSTNESHKQPTAFQEEGINDHTKSSAGGGPTDYTHKIASTVTDKLAPVYETVAGAGSAVISKVVPTDKGVSVKEYCAEKLRPGDEDKFLSEVISGPHKTQQGMKNGSDQREMREVVSDAMHKRVPEEKEDPRMGKVTVSKAVADRLGTSGHHDEAIGGGVGVGKGMVDTIRDTVGSWMGKEPESHTQHGNEGAAGGEDARQHGRYDTGGTTR